MPKQPPKKSDSRRSTKLGEKARQQDSIYKAESKKMQGEAKKFMRVYNVDKSLPNPDPTIKALGKAATAGERARKFRADSAKAATGEKLVSSRAKKNPAPADNTRVSKKRGK